MTFYSTFKSTKIMSQNNNEHESHKIFTDKPKFCKWTTLIRHRGQLRIGVNFVCNEVDPDCLKRHFEVDPD